MKVILTHLGQNVTSSMIGGKMIARVDEDIAPTSEIKRPMLGIAAARITERQKEQEKNCSFVGLTELCLIFILS